MNEFDKINIIKDAATILTLQADALRSTADIALCMQEIALYLQEVAVCGESEELLRVQENLKTLFYLLLNTQQKMQKTGTAQVLYIEGLKDQFGMSVGKLKNVRKGIVRKKS